jgi:phosphoserine phosphatase RsbU/P
MKVLIAEDELTSRAMLRAALSKMGYECIVAADGRDAWEVMQHPDAPQLAILDWMMPEIDGLELCRKLRSQERDNPLYIIILTSKAERGDIVKGLDAGADDYIAKPYDFNELNARVNVGKRILELQVKLNEREKLKGVIEMAGAVCHELNQPLQSVLGFAELLLHRITTDDDKYEIVMKIKNEAERLGRLTRKIASITRYRGKDYIPGSRIVDVDKSSQ